MWIEELSDGRYKYFERYKDPYTNKLRRVSTILDKNTPQSRNKASIILQDKIADKLSVSNTSQLTYGELLKEYLAQWLPTVKESTKRGYIVSDGHLAKVISDDTIIAKIDKKFVRNVLDELQKTKSYSVVAKCRKRLHAVLGYAIQMDYLSINPTDGVLVPKPKKEYKAEKALFLTSDEVLGLVGKLVGNDEYKVADIVLFMFLTGVRYGELAALTKDKIDLDDKKITIDGTYDFQIKETTTTKTNKSRRTISVSDNVIDIVKRNLKLSTDVVFSNSQGQPINLAYINKRLKIYGDYHTHIFRHSHISYLAENGVPLKAIMDRVGHSDPKTTLSIYSHTTINMQQLIDNATEKIAPNLPLNSNDM